MKPVPGKLYSEEGLKLYIFVQDKGYLQGVLPFNLYVT